MKKKYVVAGLCLAFSASVFANVIMVRDAFNVSSVSADGGIRFDEVGSMGAVAGGNWEAAVVSQWGISGGSATSGTGTGAVNEGALGRVVDITSITDTSLDQVNLAVNFSTANDSETLYVYLRGYTTNSTPAAANLFGNLGAQNGACWEQSYSSTIGRWTIDNLSTGDEVTSSTQANISYAVLLTSGTTGAQSVDLTFDLNGDITDYDYLGVYITRNALGTSPMATVNEITVTAIPEPATLGLIAFMGGGMLFIRRFIQM